MIRTCGLRRRGCKGAGGDRGWINHQDASCEGWESWGQWLRLLLRIGVGGGGVGGVCLCQCACDTTAAIIEAQNTYAAIGLLCASEQTARTVSNASCERHGQLRASNTKTGRTEITGNVLQILAT